MSITSKVTTHKPKITLDYPVLRMFIGNVSEKNEEQKLEPLVVLFTSLDKGIALAGVEAKRIGQSETWIDWSNEKMWAPCLITLISED